MTTYKKMVDDLVNEINFVHYNEEVIKVHKLEKAYVDANNLDGEYVISRYGRGISPHMTAKECYKALQVLSRVI